MQQAKYVWSDSWQCIKTNFLTRYWCCHNYRYRWL